VRSSRGQASVDYLAVLALVAVVIGAAAAAVGAPWLAPELAQTIRRGICIVSGSLCTAADARRAGLAPCPVHRRADSERLGATVAVARLERGDALVVERRSDGSVSVSFVDGWKGGAEVGLGARLPLPVGVDVKAGAAVGFHSGRRYDFDDAAAAGRFVARHAGGETLTGELRGLLGDLCAACAERLGGARRELPRPDATFHELGGEAQLGGTAGGKGAGVPASLGGGQKLATVVGRRREAGRTTTYLRLSADVMGDLGALVGSVAARGRAEGILEVTEEGGRRTEVRVRAAGAYANEGELDGTSLDVADVAGRLAAGGARPRVAGDRGGLALEASVALDLRDPGNARAVEALLAAGASPLAWLEGLRAVGRRLDVAGAVDLDVFRTTEATTGRTLSGSAGLRLSGGYERTAQTRELVAAWSRRAGGSLRRREDCEAAAQELAAAS
jgi:hypothetical protein